MFNLMSVMPIKLRAWDNRSISELAKSLSFLA